MSVKSCSAPPIVGLWMLSFTCWHSRSEFKCHCAHYFNSNLVFQPLAVPRLKNLCVKSSIGQLRLWTSGLLFSEEKMADYSLSSCMQHTQEWNSFQARRRQRESFSSGGSAMRLPVSTFGLAQQLLCFIQFFSSVSAARLIGISSNLFPNLNIPMKHRQIGGQSVRFTLHKRFSIAVWCLLLRQKKSLISAVQRFFDWKWKYWCLSGERRPYKSFSARPIVGLSECSLWAPTTDLTYKCHSIFSG